MDRLRLDDHQHTRQYEHETFGKSAGSSATSISLRPPSPNSAQHERSMSPSAYPARPPFGQYPSATDVLHPQAQSAVYTSSTRSEFSSTSSAIQTRRLELYEAERTTEPAHNYGLADSARRVNVLAACLPCKRAHLGCDTQRPCKRCVNMGKEALCEDVPHKKRGRPKLIKLPLSEPYSRVPRPLPSACPSLPGPVSFRHRGSVSSTTSSIPFSPSTILTNFGSAAATPTGALLTSPTGSMAVPSPYHSPPPNLSSLPASTGPNFFELFTTVDFKVVRTTPAVFDLTGFHSFEFLNLPLAEFLHPLDVHLVQADGMSLLPAGTGNTTTRRETILALNNLSPRELLSPAAGMLEPYPNQNVRFRKANGECAWFNLRLHAGGGLGADLGRHDTLDQVYFVISFLYLDQRVVSQSQHQAQAQMHTPLYPPPSAGSAGPPTPLSPPVVPSVAYPTVKISAPPAMSSLLPSYSGVPTDVGIAINAENTLTCPQTHEPEPTDSPRSPLRSNIPSPVFSRFGSATNFRSHQQASQSTQPRMAFLDPYRGPSPLPSPATSLSVGPHSGLTDARSGSGPPFSGTAHFEAYHQPSRTAIPYPQYPPQDIDGTPDALAAERTRKISGRSDTSRRAWEL